MKGEYFMADYAYIILWAAAFVFFLVFEAVTVQLVSVWLALGSLLSLIVAIFFPEVPLWVQLLIFLVASVVSLLATRPAIKKLVKSKPETNAQLDVGKTVVVTETINNELSQGRAKLNGSYWTALSVNGDIIEEGATAKIVSIDGSKLIVERIG